MFTLGSLGFLQPLLLLGLISLPILYWLLRATPPAPLIRLFPAVALLLGLKDEENTPDRTPWWLLLLRLLAVAAVIVGFAGPVLNPQERVQGSGPLVIAMDASWASAQDWQLRTDKVQELLRQAVQDNRPVALIKLSDPPRGELQFGLAAELSTTVKNLRPNAWGPDYSAWQTALVDQDFEQLIWISDGLEHTGRSAFYKSIKGDVSIVEGDSQILALRPMQFEDGALSTEVLRPKGSGVQEVEVELLGTDPAGIVRILSMQTVTLETESAEVVFELPTELRNRISQARIKGVRSAGAKSVTDDSVLSRKIALLAGQQSQEAGDLLSSLHYVRNALITSSTLIESDLNTSLLASPDIYIFADVGTLSEAENKAVLDWVNDGGVLVRFAGPRLIGSGLGQSVETPLLPVRLRAGGRDLGGAMSWGEPKKLRAFDESSPFFGLELPDDIDVNAQVIAQPDPDLANRVLASLQDGTPLITARDQGDGRVILFHVTANAQWSTLPLSGLFVKMLERLSISSGRNGQGEEELQGLVWSPLRVLDGFGELSDAENLAGVDGEALETGLVSASQQPGIYAHLDRRVALNVVDYDSTLNAFNWPVGASITNLETSQEQDLKPFLLMAALVLLAVDILATLGVSGRLMARTAVFVLAFGVIGAQGQAQDISDKDSAAIEAANNIVLAYVLTGDERVDETSKAGLVGLSAELFRRTAIEPIEPIGVSLDTAELALFPFMYWPMSDGQSVPSEAAIAKVNRYLRSGGMIMFDTRDAQMGGTSRLGRKLQEIAQSLDIPPLEPIQDDHVLTRSFYLLQDFPGRYANAPVWVEAAPDAEEQAEGMPFRNLNDGVTPVLIGGNDWAAAWAIDDNGRFMFPVGRGANGELQREYAQRFGVNLIMHVMTGNYKSDQVHIPALLDRLGQ